MSVQFNVIPVPTPGTTVRPAGAGSALYVEGILTFPSLLTLSIVAELIAPVLWEVEMSPIVMLVFIAMATAPIRVHNVPSVERYPENVLPALLGQKNAKGRDKLVLQNNGQSPLALRAGAWKLIARPNGKPELYNLADDLAEAHDLAGAQPEREKELTALLAAERARAK